MCIACQFIDEDHGYFLGQSFIGNGETLFRKTIDGGNTFIDMSEPLKGLEYPGFGQGTVAFINPETGWLAGAGAEILKTEDGGKTWKRPKAFPDGVITTMYAIDGNRVYGVRGGGSLVRTLDGGENWTVLNVPSKAGLTSVYSSDSINVYALSESGEILKSSDGGNSWVNQESGSSSLLTSMFFIGEDLGWVVGRNGTILKTRNGGAANLGIRHLSEKSEVAIRNGRIEFQLREPSTVTIDRIRMDGRRATFLSGMVLKTGTHVFPLPSVRRNNNFFRIRIEDKFKSRIVTLPFK